MYTNESVKNVLFALILNSRSQSTGYVTYTLKRIGIERKVDANYHEISLDKGDTYRDFDDDIEDIEFSDEESDNTPKYYLEDGDDDYGRDYNIEEEISFYHHLGDDTKRFLRLYIQSSGNTSDVFGPTEYVDVIKVDYADVSSFHNVIDPISFIRGIEVFILHRIDECEFHWNPDTFDLVRKMAVTMDIDSEYDKNIFEIIHSMMTKKVNIQSEIIDEYEKKDIQKEAYYGGEYDQISLENIYVKKPSQSKHIFLGYCGQLNLNLNKKFYNIKNFSDMKIDKRRKKNSPPKIHKIIADDGLPF